MTHRSVHHAFSLVELSIVLVILGLLVGGVLSGQALIKSATLRKQLVQLTDIQTAMNTFKDKYLALPGDMSNATAFWGATDSDGAWVGNGDGDGMLTSDVDHTDCLSYRANSAHGGGGPLFEPEYLWHHLSLSGMYNFKPKYDNVYLKWRWPTLAYDSSYHLLVTCTLFSHGGVWQVPLNRQFATPVLIFPFDVHNTGGDQTADQTIYAAGIQQPEVWSGGIDPDDARVMDTKVDDGNPSQGTMWVLSGCGLGQTVYTGLVCATPYSVLADKL